MGWVGPRPVRLAAPGSGRPALAEVAPTQTLGSSGHPPVRMEDQRATGPGPTETSAGTDRLPARRC